MSENKVIDRKAQGANKIFNQRSLDKDYPTLKPLLKNSLRVLDIGCGTGSITKDIAKHIGPDGYIIGIDNTKQFITEGKALFGDIKNMELLHADLLDFQPQEQFDLIVSARTFQWISTIDKAIHKLKELLKPMGKVSILDYNHEGITWNPAIPASMSHFYNTFLKWRTEAGMNNRIGEEIAYRLAERGFSNIEVLNADEHYGITCPEDIEKIKIWSKVAKSSQMVDEGYITNTERLQAITDYDEWVDFSAQNMIMKLNEVRACL